MSRLHRGRQALKSALSESGFRYPMIDYVGPDPVLIMAGRSGQRGRGMPVPDLKGAWIARVRWQEDRLVLTLDGVRHRGLLFAGDVTFEGVGKVEGSDPRLTSGALVLTAGMTIRAQESRPGETMLDLLRQTGPGDADEPRFVITYRDVTMTLRVNAGATARAWLGFYPLPRDRRPTG